MVLGRASFHLLLVKVGLKGKQWRNDWVAEACPVPHQMLLLHGIGLLAEAEGE